MKNLSLNDNKEVDEKTLRYILLSDIEDRMISCMDEKMLDAYLERQIWE